MSSEHNYPQHTLNDVIIIKMDAAKQPNFLHAVLAMLEIDARAQSNAEQAADWQRLRHIMEKSYKLKTLDTDILK